MGFKDFDRLEKVKLLIDRFFKEAGKRIPYEMDSGHHETRIYINLNQKSWQRTENKTIAESLMSMGSRPFEPDFLLDVDTGFGSQYAIIEYEEEPKAGSRPKYNVKGHNPLNKRDSRRDEHYAACNFHFLKLWDSQSQIHEEQIREFIRSLFVIQEYEQSRRILRV